MKRKLSSGLILGSFLLFALSCNKTVYVPYTPTADDSQRSGITADNLESGRVLFTANCDKCHGLKAPERYTKEKWANVMPRMQKKSKLSGDEGQLILQYVQARAKL